KQNDKVQILSKGNGWATINYKGTTGYVSLAFLQITSVAQTPPAAETGTVTATFLNVRAKASLQSNVIGTLKMGEAVTVLSKDGDWATVEYKGSQAYASLKYISFGQSNTSTPVEQK